jgi:hypothetical protein
MQQILKILLIILVLLFLAGLVLFAVTSRRVPFSNTDSTASVGTTTEVPQTVTEDIALNPTATTSGNFFLTVSSPANGLTQKSKYLTVKGKSVPGAEIFVNDKEGKADSSGNFAVNIILDEGENTVVVIANDELGNVQEKDLTVTVETF